MLYSPIMAGRRLTDEKYWDNVWTPGSGNSPRRSRWKRFLLEAPAVKQLWVKLLPQYLPPGPAQVAELGSAPGKELLQWRDRFGCDVFGVDFSQEGIREQRELFSRCGLDDTHSLLADFLGEAFQRQHRDRFDVVCSQGLIEHFADPHDAIAAHVRILKPGGLLYISIPNLAGLYRHLVPTSMLDVHNLNIMRLEAFRAVFEGHQLQPLYCGYLGRLDLGIAYSGETAFCRFLLWMQVLANALLHFIPIPDNGWTSPRLVFLGRKAG
jgi:SAM-dependent methyltransferase